MDLPNGQKFELHCHSHYSRGTKIPCEGISSPRDIVRAARKKGLAGLALTDHDTNRGWEEAAEEAERMGLVFIPGIEISTKGGHVLGLGLSGGIKPGISVDETIDRIHEQSGIAIAAHPFNIRGWGCRYDMKKADAVEAFNSMCIDRVSNAFTERLAKRLGMPSVAATDAHSKEMVGAATTEMYAHDADSVLREIVKKRTVLNRGYMPMNILVDWAKTRMSVSYDDVMSYIKSNYWQPKAWISEALMHKFLFSRRRWGYNALAKFGASCSVVYGGIKMLTYL